MEAVRLAAESLEGTLAQMRAIEEMRRTLRAVRDLTKLDLH